jgi:uncharacterized protein
MNEQPSPSSSNQRTVPLPARVVVSLRAGAVLALANIVCVLIFSWSWVHVKADPKSISVTGSARKAIESDLIVWSARVSASDPDLKAAYDSLDASLQKTLAYLKAQGIPTGEITVASIQTSKHHERDGQGHETEKIASYELAQDVEVTSSDVGRVADTARTVTGLIKDGVLLESYPPRYLYTKMADLKITMLAEATRDATTRAQQIAGNSGSTLGAIIDARMGVMQINAIHSDDVSGSGVNDTSSKQKEITAVVSARFGLR